VDWRAALRSLHGRIQNMAARATLAQIDDSKPIQLIQVEALSGEVRDLVQRVQPFGFSSVPLVGAYPVVLLCPFGDRAQALAVVVDDVRHRPTGQGPGDSQVYDTHGNHVRLSADGVEIVSAAQGTVSVAADLTIEAGGNVSVTAAGDATVTATNANLVASAAATVQAPQVNLGGPGGAAVARVGDAVLVGSVPGVITGGSLVVKAT
jgi:phage baseplate assembly protein V